MSNKNSTLVYSTDKKELEKIKQKKDPIIINNKPTTIGIEKKGRSGKKVTVIYNLKLTQSDLKILLSQIKKQLGVGGTLKGSNIEIQGEHINQLKAFLEAKAIKII